jgi:hypothetical protein
MNGWYRVFGSNDVQPQPAALLELLRSLGREAKGNFHGDDQGWFEAEIVFAAGGPPLQLDRFLAKEEGLRSELNTWAAWLETVEDNPHHAALMQQVIGTTQLFTLCQAGQEGKSRVLDEIGGAVCQFLARETAGIYQADQLGFFAADGSLLVQE